MTGRLFAVVGPSGAGKDTLLAGVCGDAGLHWVRRVITRPESPGGEPFEGVSCGEFATREALDAFALTWNAHGLRYGIPRTELAPLQDGRDVVFNGSRAALEQAAGVFPGLQVIHVTAPAEVLAKRLKGRGRETARQIASRLARSVDDVPIGLPVIEIVNDSSPEEGIAKLKDALQRTLAR
jgi:phosphonate metabolism protein PhnN/1,5-bisphosphokinase (PRPP-forming)